MSRCQHASGNCPIRKLVGHASSARAMKSSVWKATGKNFLSYSTRHASCGATPWISRSPRLATKLKVVDDVADIVPAPAPPEFDLAPTRNQHSGWTAERERKFMEHLHRRSARPLASVPPRAHGLPGRRRMPDRSCEPYRRSPRENELMRRQSGDCRALSSRAYARVGL